MIKPLIHKLIKIMDKNKKYLKTIFRKICSVDIIKGLKSDYSKILDCDYIVDNLID